MATIIEMPKLSDTMSVGTVVKWHKQRGDKVSEGDVLAEIETDKATMELENFENGVLLKVFVEEGVEVAIGSALAAVGEEGEVIEDIDAPDPRWGFKRNRPALKKSRPVKAKAASRRRKRNLLSLRLGPKSMSRRTLTEKRKGRVEEKRRSKARYRQREFWLRRSPRRSLVNRILI